MRLDNQFRMKNLVASIVNHVTRRMFVTILAVNLCMLLSCQKGSRTHEVSNYVFRHDDYFSKIVTHASFRHDTLVIVDRITNTSGDGLVLLPSLAYIDDPESAEFILNRFSLGNSLYISRDSMFDVPSLWDRSIAYDPAYKYQFFVLFSDSTIVFEYRLPCRLLSLQKFMNAKFISPFGYCVWSSADTLMGTRKLEYITEKKAVLTVFHNGVTTFPYRDPYVFNMLTKELNGTVEVQDEDYFKLRTSNIRRLLDTSRPNAIPITRR